MACRARDCCRGPFHQQCRGRDELHPVPVRPAAARLRFRESGQRRRVRPYRRARRRRRRAPDHPGRGGPRADERHDGHRHPRARCGARRRHGRREQRGHRGDHLRAFGVRRLRARPHLPHEPQPGPYLRGLHALRARRGRSLVRSGLPGCGGASGRGVRGHGAPRRGRRLRASHRPSGAHLPHPALCGHDGGRHSRRLHRGHSRAPRLCR